MNQKNKIMIKVIKVETIFIKREKMTVTKDNPHNWQYKADKKNKNRVCILCVCVCAHVNKKIFLKGWRQ